MWRRKGPPGQQDRSSLPTGTSTRAPAPTRKIGRAARIRRRNSAVATAQPPAPPPHLRASGASRQDLLISASRLDTISEEASWPHQRTNPGRSDNDTGDTAQADAAVGYSYPSEDLSELKSAEVFSDGIVEFWPVAAVATEAGEGRSEPSTTQSTSARATAGSSSSNEAPPEGNEAINASRPPQPLVRLERMSIQPMNSSSPSTGTSVSPKSSVKACAPKIPGIAGTKNFLLDDPVIRRFLTGETDDCDGGGSVSVSFDAPTRDCTSDGSLRTIKEVRFLAVDTVRSCTSVGPARPARSRSRSEDSMLSLLMEVSRDGHCVTRAKSASNASGSVSEQQLTTTSSDPSPQIEWESARMGFTQSSTESQRGVTGSSSTEVEEIESGLALSPIESKDESSQSLLKKGASSSYSSKDTTPERSSQSERTPQQKEQVRTPQQKEQVRTPQKKEQVRTPQQKEQERTPQQKEQVRTPQQKEQERTPQKKEQVRTPQKEQVRTPQQKEQVRTPQQKEQVRTPQQKEQERTPQKKEQVRTPQKNEQVRTPQQKEQVRTPQQKEQERTPQQKEQEREGQEQQGQKLQQQEQQEQKDQNQLLKEKMQQLQKQLDQQQQHTDPKTQASGESAPNARDAGATASDTGGFANWKCPDRLLNQGGVQRMMSADRVLQSNYGPNFCCSSVRRNGNLCRDHLVDYRVRLRQLMHQFLLEQQCGDCDCISSCCGGGRFMGGVCSGGGGCCGGGGGGCCGGGGYQRRCCHMQQQPMCHASHCGCPCSAPARCSSCCCRRGTQTSTPPLPAPLVSGRRPLLLRPISCGGGEVGSAMSRLSPGQGQQQPAAQQQQPQSANCSAGAPRANWARPTGCWTRPGAGLGNVEPGATSWKPLSSKRAESLERVSFGNSRVTPC